MYHKMLLIFIALTFLSCFNQNTIAPSTKTNHSTPVDTTPINIILIKKASAHLSKPYLVHTLDSSASEELTVRMDGFDCTTLVETVVAEALDSNDIAGHIKMTRYRNGIISDYASRIHYFTEWIYENQKSGLVQDVTKEFDCSKPFVFKVGFMTQHRNKYAQLKDDSIFNKIKAMEKKINAYKWHYIPKNKLASCQAAINHGDIIAITSNVPGLDIAHLGFAYRKGSQLYLLHASTDEKKVVITKKTLLQYLMDHSKQSGIMVVRVKK